MIDLACLGGAAAEVAPVPLLSLPFVDADEAAPVPPCACCPESVEVDKEERPLKRSLKVFLLLEMPAFRMVANSFTIRFAPSASLCVVFASCSHLWTSICFAEGLWLGSFLNEHSSQSRQFYMNTRGMCESCCNLCGDIADIVDVELH